MSHPVTTERLKGNTPQQIYATSVFYEQGKLKFIIILRKPPQLKTPVKIFKDENVELDAIAKAG